MRGAITAGQAQAAMRLAAAAGWYWWLSGHKVEGMELVTAANETPGEVTDEVRAVVYGYVVGFASSGRGADENSAAEWIHRLYDLSQRVRNRHPAVITQETQICRSGASRSPPERLGVDLTCR